MGRLVLSLLLCLMPAAAGFAQSAAPPVVRLRGPLVQGGLIVGRTHPGAAVEVDGRTLRVGEDGTLVFGIGRDAAPRARLRITLADGRVRTRVLEIRRRRFRRQRIDNLPPAMVTPPEELAPRILAEQTRLAALWGVDTPEPLFATGFAWPLRGIITGVYGSQRILNGQPRQPHWGLDIAAPEGTPVRAPADGVVLLAESGFYYTGGTILLDHGFGLVSGFLHLSALDVSEGQHVKRGEPIGKVGSTGRATGPHLDWRVRWLDVFVDPRLLLPRP